MSATERVRELLDDRGVEWEDCGNGATYVEHNGEAWRFDYDEPFDQLAIVCLSGYTPEQAIAATLGPTATTVDETETWECVCDQIGRYGKRVAIHVMECSECGHTYEHVNGDYEFCPHCGRRVVEVDA